MRTANAVLSSLDGREVRCFGNTCCNTELGEGETLHSLEPLIEELFVAGRGLHNNQVADGGPSISTPWGISAATAAVWTACGRKSIRPPPQEAGSST